MKTSLPFFFAASSLLAACQSQLADQQDVLERPDKPGISISVQKAHYAVQEVNEGGRREYRMEIPFVVTNNTDSTLRETGCMRPSSPLLSVQEGTGWKYLWGPIELECYSEYPLAAGAARRDTFRLRAGSDELAFDEDAIYRLDYRILTGVDPARHLELASETFTIAVE